MSEIEIPKIYYKISNSREIIGFCDSNNQKWHQNFLGKLIYSPEEISKIFTLSKSAFKRAVGALYKERLIEIEDYKIILKNEKH